MAANEVTIIANAGTYTGLNGTAIMYVGTVNGKYAWFYKFLNTTPDPDVEQWSFMSKDAFLNGVALGDATYHSGVDVNSFLNDDAAAAFLEPVTGNPWKVKTVLNEASPVLPRLYGQQPFYSLRGQGINTIDGNTASFSNNATSTTVTGTTTTTTTAGGTTTVTAAASNSSASFLDGILPASVITFINKNAVWIFIAMLVLAYLWYTEKNKKGKKKSKFLGLF